jgi:hypothetical protein
LFKKPGCGTHINFIPQHNHGYIISNNNEGFVEIIEKGKQTPTKRLDIELMHCSLVHDGKLFIGS